MTSPLVAIVLVNYNGLADTRECVASVEKISYPNWRLFILDNASPNGDGPRVAAEFGGRHTVILNPTNTGFTGGNNLPMARAFAEGADYVCLLNNDTTVESDFLEPLVETMQANPKCGCVGGKIYYFKEPKKIWCAGVRVSGGYIGFNQADAPENSKLTESDFVVGCLMLVRRQTHEQVGGMDDGYFLYCEEVDWCYRMRAAGWGLLCDPRSRIYHKISASAGVDSAVSIYYGTRNSGHLLWKWNKGSKRFWKMARWWWHRTKHLAGYLFVTRDFRRAGVLFRAVGDFLCGVRGPAKL